MALIDVQRVTKIFGPRPGDALARVQSGLSKEALLAETGHTLGLHDISLAIDRGEIFVIMGLSGSGKSTLIRHFNRLIDPTAGRIVVDGTDIMELSEAELRRFRRQRTSMVFQRFGLLPHRTVLDNVAYGLKVQGQEAKARRAVALEWIDAVGLKGFEKQFPSQLSGGMQQRVGLARALATDADILLMDEAFSALDPLIRSQMQDQLLELQNRLHKTIVFITHDLDEALRIGDRIAILKDGRLSQVGTPPQILLNPADDYVRAFVRDVNRARVLTVESVMRPPSLRITSDDLDHALAELRRQGANYGYVVADDGYRGVVTQQAVEQALATGNATTTVADATEAQPSLGPEDTLERALPMTLECDYPVAVVDREGDLKGTVSRTQMGNVLNIQTPNPPAAPGFEAIPEAAATEARRRAS